MSSFLASKMLHHSFNLNLSILKTLFLDWSMQSSSNITIMGKDDHHQNENEQHELAQVLQLSFFVSRVFLTNLDSHNNSVRMFVWFTASLVVFFYLQSSSFIFISFSIPLAWLTRLFVLLPSSKLLRYSCVLYVHVFLIFGSDYLFDSF